MYLFSNYPNGGKLRGISNNTNSIICGIVFKSKEVVFFNVIEFYKVKTVIAKIVSKSENELEVYLLDGENKLFLLLM